VSGNINKSPTGFGGGTEEKEMSFTEQNTNWDSFPVVGKKQAGGKKKKKKNAGGGGGERKMVVNPTGEQNTTNGLKKRPGERTGDNGRETGRGGGKGGKKMKKSNNKTWGPPGITQLDTKKTEKNNRHRAMGNWGKHKKEGDQKKGTSTPGPPTNHAGQPKHTQQK